MVTSPSGTNDGGLNDNVSSENIVLLLRFSKISRFHGKVLKRMCVHWKRCSWHTRPLVGAQGIFVIKSCVHEENNTL